MSTVDSQKNPYKKLNSKQIEELKKIIRKGIKKIHSTETAAVCSGKDSC